MAFHGGGPEATERIPPMKTRRVEEVKGFKCGLQGWNPAGRMLAHFNWCLRRPGDTGILPWRGPRKARAPTPAESNAQAPWEAVKV